VLTLDPKHASAWKYKGLSLFDLKKTYDSITAFSMAIEIDPKIETA